MKNRIMRSPKKFIAGLVAVVISGALLWGISWATFARPPLPEAIEALDGDDQVNVTNEPWLTFSPAKVEPTTGFIFYPGGRVDPRGYAPLMKEIAAEGYLVVVPEMPVNMAVFNPNIADDIISSYPHINRWVIAGHSVGGTMAAQYSYQNQETIDGLVIWASYPAGNSSLSGSDIPVVSIYGSQDPGVGDAAIAERKKLLPEKTVYVRIDGGDHHQFGAYVIKPEEHHATISPVSQHEQIIRATLALLFEIEQK